MPVTALTIAVAYPILIAKDWLWSDSVPIFSNVPTMDTMVIMAVYVMMALGLNMVVGYAGLLDLGYVAFFAIGAYSAAWFASPHFARPDFATGLPSIDINIGAVGVFPGVGGIHISIWAVLLIAAAITAIAGVAHRVCRRCACAATTSRSSRSASGRWLPRSHATATSFSSASTSRTARRGSTPSTRRASDRGSTTRSACRRTSSRLKGGSRRSPTCSWAGSSTSCTGARSALVLVTLFCSIRLRDSRLGRAWIAIREDETAAAAMGIPLMRTKTWSYASGAFFGGVAGAWFGSFQTAVFPDTFNFNVSVFILCMVILGGMGNVWGVIAGASFLAFLNTRGSRRWGVG